MAGHRRFVTAVGVDALGSGVFMPLAVLYFLHTTPLSLAQVGLALSTAAAVGFPIVLVAGQLVDRVGAKRVLLSANLVQALAYLAFPTVDTLGGVILVTSAAAIGQASFWASFSPIVAAIARPGERELWSGFLGALRNLGFAIGGLLSGIAVTIGTEAAYHAVVLANAGSYLLALVLLAGVPGPPAQRHAPGHLDGWLAVARDRPYLLLVLTNLGYAVCAMALNFAMPVYAVELLGLPGWVGGAIFVLNTILVAGAQGLVVRGMTGRRRFGVAAASFAVYAVGFLALAATAALREAVGLAVLAVLGAVAVYTLGELLGGPVLSAMAMESAPESLRGRYFSVYQLSWNVSGIIAPVVFAGWMAAGLVTVWFALAGIAAVSLLLSLGLARVLPVAAAPVTNQAIESADPVGTGSS